MVRIENYVKQLIQSLRETFADRLIYVGLQGSYARGEADENSDIDVMVVLDKLEPSDLRLYKELIRAQCPGETPCGFISGAEELKRWNPCEVCQLLHETIDYYGHLKELVPSYTHRDVDTHVRIGAGNLYHELCHRYIYNTPEKNVQGLPGCYKQVFYILQNLHYLRTGEYVRSKRELFSLLSGLDREVLAMALSIKAGENWDFDQAYSLLFDWCGEILRG